MSEPATPTSPPPAKELRAERRRFEADRLTKLLLFLSFVSLVVLAGLAVLVQRNSRNNDDLSSHVEEVEASVHRVERFVDDLETLTPEEEAQNAAVTEAVQQVPEIRVILCQAFPSVPACQTG